MLKIGTLVDNKENKRGVVRSITKDQAQVIFLLDNSHISCKIEDLKIVNIENEEKELINNTRMLAIDYLNNYIPTGYSVDNFTYSIYYQNGVRLTFSPNLKELEIVRNKQATIISDFDSVLFNDAYDFTKQLISNLKGLERNQAMKDLISEGTK